MPGFRKVVGSPRMFQLAMVYSRRARQIRLAIAIRVGRSAGPMGGRMVRGTRKRDGGAGARSDCLSALFVSDLRAGQPVRGGINGHTCAFRRRGQRISGQPRPEIRKTIVSGVVLALVRFSTRFLFRDSGNYRCPQVLWMGFVDGTKTWGLAGSGIRAGRATDASC